MSFEKPKEMDAHMNPTRLLSIVLAPIGALVADARVFPGCRAIRVPTVSLFWLVCAQVLRNNGFRARHAAYTEAFM